MQLTVYARNERFNVNSIGDFELTELARAMYFIGSNSLIESNRKIDEYRLSCMYMYVCIILLVLFQYIPRLIIRYR